METKCLLAVFFSDNWNAVKSGNWFLFIFLFNLSESCEIILILVVVVPEQAVVLDWVFADGPPQNATVYDNNHRHDFHAIVPKSIPAEQYWVEEEHQIYRKLQEERRLREEAKRAKVSAVNIKYDPTDACMM